MDSKQQPESRGGADPEPGRARRVAIVSGGSRGIGRAIVEALAAAGVEVHFTYLANQTAAASVVDTLAARGQKVTAAQVDARDAAASAAMVERTIETAGQLDVLVNNAGVTADRLLALMTESDWSKVVDTSLNGLFGMSRVATRQMMRQRSGRIINLTSVSGLMGMRGQTNYSAAKAAIIGFTRSLAVEVATVGVSVNAVAPGFIDTDMLGTLSAADRERFLASVPMGRFAAAAEVANLVQYLALEAPGYLTGQTLTIDGGLSV